MRLYVNINAEENGNGSEKCPFKHINDAAKVAQPGDEVWVAPGIYREYVNPQNSGTESARISYRSAVPLKAVITGAESIKTWKRHKGNVWVCRVSNQIFGDYNPYTTFVYGDWYFAGLNRHTGAVYLNDKMLYEVDSLEDCIDAKPSPYSWEPEASVRKWYTEQDGDETLIYANFQAADPNKENVEINVRRECFMPAETGVDYQTVSGFKIDKAATTWAPPAAYQDGMIGPHWSKGWIIEDCEICNSKCAGISLGKYYDPENDNYFTRYHVKSPTQMERDAVCRGQYHGWLKEKIGGHIIRRCDIHNCEQGGIIGRMGGVFSLIEDNHIHHINNMMELGGAEIAGIKLHAAIDVIIRRNRIHNCTMGIWCDWEAQGTRISQNLLYDNRRPDFAEQLPGGLMCQDLFVEVSHGPTLIDNNILLSDVSLRFASEGVAMVHNLICGAFTVVGAGTDCFVDGVLRVRYTPYHIPHRTELMGFMTVLHGDDRIYNNIFVQKWPSESRLIRHDSDDGFDYENREVGTHVLDKFPLREDWIKDFDPDTPTPNMKKMESAHFRPLPVWVDGNAYFNGAKSFRAEKTRLEDTEHSVALELKTVNGMPILSTDLYDFLADFTVRPVSTETLGRAFQADELFENPDGTPISFDRDFFGEKRGASVLPGPFANREDAEKVLRQR